MLYIVIVNYNSHNDLTECLESLTRADYEDFRVVIVDNGSEAKSVTAIEDWFGAASNSEAYNAAVWSKLPAQRRRKLVLRASPASEPWRAEPVGTVNLLLTGKNLGFAGANNVGLEFAFRDPDCQNVLLLNPDTVVTPGFVGPVLERMQDPTVGMCGSTLLYYDETDTIQTCGSHFNSWLQHTTILGEGLPLKDRPDQKQVEHQLSYVAGAAMMVSRAFYEAVGPMYEGYFLYFEEPDWARRAEGKFTLAWAPQSIIYHKEGGSIGSSQRSRPSDTSIYYLSINLLRFQQRLARAFVPLAVVRLLLLALRYVLRRDGDGARVILQVLKDFWAGRYRTGRIDMQKLSSVSPS